VTPIARSGLSAMTLQSKHIKPLNIFHRKVMRSFLGLSDKSPIPCAYFLTGELPLEATLHKDVFTLFHNVWSNPETKIFEIVKFLLLNCPKNSHTWSRHVMNLAVMYGINDPALAIQSVPPSKTEYSKLTLTKITAYHESELRKGLNGQPHPILLNIFTSRDALKARSHVKFLCGDIYTQKRKSKYKGGSAICRLCDCQEIEEIVHIITTCTSYDDMRERILNEMRIVCDSKLPETFFNEISQDKRLLTQFILDCTSMNLPNRISPDSDFFIEILRLSRDLCYGISRQRTEKLKLLKT